MPIKIEKVNFEKHYLTTTSAQVKAIVHPLKKWGVTTFNHFRIYDDNSAIDLTTTPEFCEYYGKNYLYREGCAGNFDVYYDGYFFWDTLIGSSAVFKALEQQCHTAHGVTIVKVYENFCDHFYLGGASNNPHIKNFFISQKELIENFIDYYYLEASQLISNARQHSYIFPNDKKECDEMLKSFSIPREDFYVFKKSFFIKNRFNRNYFLTEREIECIYHSSLGKSAKTVAHHLNISRRTVERHLENIRIKFGVKNKVALIKMAHDFHIFD